MKRRIALAVMGMMVLAFSVTCVEAAADQWSRSPAKVIDIVIDRAQLREFLDEMGEFATAQRFSADLSQTSPELGDLLLQLQRPDVSLIMTRREGWSRFTYGIGIYKSMTVPINDLSIDELVVSLRTIAERIDGAEFTIEK
jgi:hypothetical protein